MHGVDKQKQSQCRSANQIRVSELPVELELNKHPLKDNQIKHGLGNYIWNTTSYFPNRFTLHCLQRNVFLNIYYKYKMYSVIQNLQ